MRLYANNASYAGYDKNHKEREALDYYSTPTEEVENILNILNLPFEDSVILEPCAGAGHMLQGIENYLQKTGQTPKEILASDIQSRGNITKTPIWWGEDCDYLSDNYKFKKADYIIMNPPYSVVEPFMMKALSTADKGVVMLGRLQMLEGVKRYEKVFKDCPPTDVYVYIDRIGCFKNGDTTQKQNSCQAYAWFYWDTSKTVQDGFPRLHWIHRVNSK